MTTGQKIRWGIVGAGRIAHQFAEDMTWVGNGELVAVASRSQVTATAFAHTYGTSRAYADYEALYADPDVDAVYIATPHALHFRHCVAALQAGKAVLCEKPVTVGAEEFESLCTIASAAGRFLMEGMWTWFLPAVRKAQQWVAEGRIGAVRHVKADFGYPLLPYDSGRREYDRTLGGGALLEMGIYPIALARLFIGQDPNRIHVAAHHAENGVEDDVVMLFEYDDSIATLATSFRCKLQNCAYVIGDDGYIALPDFWRASACHLFELDSRVDSFEDHRKGSGFEFQIEAVSDDISDGRKQSQTVPLSASLAFQQHMDRVRAKF